MIFTRKGLASLFASFGALVALSACGGMPLMGGPPPAGYDPNKVPGMPAEEAEVACDPKGCSDFCMNMRCVFDEIGIDKCMAVCTSRCGDTYFEEQDKGVMACIARVGPDLSCESTHTCCREFLTNQLCSQ